MHMVKYHRSDGELDQVQIVPEEQSTAAVPLEAAMRRNLERNNAISGHWRCLHCPQFFDVYHAMMTKAQALSHVTKKYVR